MESLFRRLSRYPRSPSVDPRENRLTETTAAVLERVDDAARHLVADVLGLAVEDAERQAAAPEMGPAPNLGALRAAHAACVELTGARATVSTQVGTPDGRFVDMAVSLRGADNLIGVPDVLVWFEVKYGADLHGDQADAYVQAITSFPAEHRVVLLLKPRGQELKGDLPPEVPVVAWQTMARTMREMLDLSDLPPVQAWLLGEYVTYLDEEGLMDPHGLTAEHVAALAGLDDAMDALAGVCEHAHAAVSASWAKPDDWKTPRGASEEPEYGPEFWASFAAQPRTSKWHEGWFDWGVGVPSDWQYADDPGRGSIAFFSGVAFCARANPYNDPKNEGWVAALLANEFVYCWFDGAYRLVRALYPDELLTETSAEAQGHQLGRWAVETFTFLRDHPPTH
jgi:hypothetical protein